MSDISREELAAFTEAHTKSATVLQRVTETLESISRGQERLFEKLTNGISGTIIDGVSANYSNAHRETLEILGKCLLSHSEIRENQKTIMAELDKGIPNIIDEKLSGSSIATDIKHVKWFVGIIGVTVIVAMVIIKLLAGATSEKLVSVQYQVLQHMLTEQQVHDDQLKGLK